MNNEKITFIASLPPEHRTAMSFNGDGSAKLVFLTSTSELDKVVKLIMMKELPLKITVEVDNENIVSQINSEN